MKPKCIYLPISDIILDLNFSRTFRRRTTESNTGGLGRAGRGGGRSSRRVARTRRRSSWRNPVTPVCGTARRRRDLRSAMNVCIIVRISHLRWKSGSMRVTRLHWPSSLLRLKSPGQPIMECDFSMKVWRSAIYDSRKAMKVMNTANYELQKFVVGAWRLSSLDRCFKSQASVTKIWI